MFYSKCLLSKKGSLGVIWVAAYCYRRLKKKQVFTTDISSSVDEILQKELDITTYRVLAYLLLGLARIFSKKVEYLCDDCQDVMTKVKDFVVTVTGKNKTLQRAPFGSITLPDSFELDAFDLEIVEDVSGNNVLPYEQITLKGEASTSGTKELYSVGKDSCQELSAFHDTFLTDYAPAEDILLFESMEIDLDTSTSHGLSIIKTSSEKHHGNNSSQEAWVNLGMICGNDGEHANSIYLTGEDQCLGRELIEVPVIAQPENGVQGESSTVKHKNSMSPGDGEEPVDLGKVHSEDNQSDGDQTNIPHLEQSEKQMYQAINEDNYIDGDQSIDGDQDIDGEPLEVSIIAQPENGAQGEASTEKHLNNRSPDLGKVHGEDNQFDGDQMKIPHLAQSEKEMCQAMNEDNNLSNLQASMEKLLDPRIIHEVCMDVEMVCGSEEECAELSEPSCEEDHTNSVQINSMEMSLSTDDKCHSMIEDDPKSTVDATPQSKFLDASDATAPEFVVVDTPATNDRAHRSRRRKCYFDDVVLFSNNQMRQHLEDTSDLVSKRKKAPRTALSARISNLSQDFSAPLLPYISSELTSLFRLEKSKILEIAETVESLDQNCSTVGKSLEQIDSAPETTAIRSLEQMAIAGPETPMAISQEKMTIARGAPAGRSLEKMTILPEEVTGRYLEQHAVAPETPVLPSREKRPFETPASQLASYSDMIMQAHSFQDVEKEPSSSTDQECDLMTEEPDSSEVDKSELDGLSTRTRMVVKYLHRKFLDQKKRTENEAVNLKQLLKGKTKKESARLFYETLVLKSKGYVDVKQDDAYGDIQVQKVPQWDQSYAVLFPQDDSCGDIQVPQVPKWNKRGAVLLP